MDFQSWEFSCSGVIDSYNFNIEVFIFHTSDSCSFKVSKSPHDLVPNTPHLHLEVLNFWDQGRLQHLHLEFLLFRDQGLPQHLHFEVCNF
jgi:hypothetical protein